MPANPTVGNASPDAADFEGQDQPPEAPTIDESTKRKRNNNAQVSIFSNHRFNPPEWLYFSLNSYSGCLCMMQLLMRSCGMMGLAIFWEMSTAFRAIRMSGYSSAKTVWGDVAFVVRPALCWLTSICPYTELRYVTFDNPEYIKFNTDFVILEIDRGIFRQRLP